MTVQWRLPGTRQSGCTSAVTARTCSAAQGWSRHREKMSPQSGQDWEKNFNDSPISLLTQAELQKIFHDLEKDWRSPETKIKDKNQKIIEKISGFKARNNSESEGNCLSRWLLRILQNIRKKTLRSLLLSLLLDRKKTSYYKRQKQLQEQWVSSAGHDITMGLTEGIAVKTIHILIWTGTDAGRLEEHGRLRLLDDRLLYSCREDRVNQVKEGRTTGGLNTM